MLHAAQEPGFGTMGSAARAMEMPSSLKNSIGMCRHLRPGLPEMQARSVNDEVADSKT